MTVQSAAAPATSGPPQALRRHWRLLALVAVGFLPFLPSIRAMDSFLLADNALGFVPLMLPMAAYVFWVRAHSESAPSKRDVVLDVFFAMPLLVAALFVLIVTPSRLSWYFWLNRVDLLALPLFVGATAFIFLGYQQVLRTWPAFGLLFLSWPWVVVRVQQELGGVFLEVTTAVAAGAVAFLRLPYEADPQFAQAFVSTHLPQGENFEVVLGQVCSGTSTFIGFGLIGIGLLYLLRGPWGQRLRWLAWGLLLAFAANLLRVVALLALAATAGERVTLDVIHPVLGLALFVALLAFMLWLLPRFGLALELRPRGTRRVWEPVDGGGRPLRALYGVAVGVAALVAVLDVQAQQYSFLGIGDGAPAIDVTSERAIVPEIEGWRLEHVADVSWTDLFGRHSRGDVFEYGHPGGQWITVQSIVADRKSTLDRYPLEQCILFHRRTVEGREQVALGHGVIGVIVHDTYEGVPSSSLYYQIPVNVDGDIRHARVTLFSDVEGPRHEVQDLPSTALFTNRVGVALGNALDGEGGRDALRAQVDLELIELAARIIDTMVTTGGPAKALEGAAAADAAAAGAALAGARGQT